MFPRGMSDLQAPFALQELLVPLVTLLTVLGLAFAYFVRELGHWQRNFRYPGVRGLVLFLFDFGVGGWAASCEAVPRMTSATRFN